MKDPLVPRVHIAFPQSCECETWTGTICEMLHVKELSACLWVRRCGVGAVAHLQSYRLSGRPDPLCAPGRAGRRHPHCPRGSLPGKISRKITILLLFCTVFKRQRPEKVKFIYRNCV